ncbi:MAG: DUF937 domain-containing protein [Verrucomicrobiales bacterium]|jgi:hypothetical protein|nr:DUF937 domain-containing protein [Verrucomicrobiales bacterium]MDP4793463.1 DUF937 domain-containing protein [Verrucomicrobiales bacterium]MDP5005198.1 DUF937 domain-containing protein [Verrucomicrobiales bacterium]
MPTLLEQLIQDHGDEITRKISGTLGVTREEAAGVLSATAPVILGRFESARVPIAGGGESLDHLLEGTGEQMNARVRDEVGVTPEQAAKVIPLIVPIVLRFLMRRVPFGNTAVPILTSFVEQQGYGSLDELAMRLARKFTPSPSTPSIPTMLGRWAGKYFPSGD